MNVLKLVASALLLVLVGCTDSANVESAGNWVGPEDPIRVRFSRRMKPDTVSEDTFTVFGKHYGDYYPGEVSGEDDERTFSFSPGNRDGDETGWVPGDVLRVNLTDRIVSADNIPFEGRSFVVHVRGELPDVFAGPLTVQSTTPANGASHVPLGTLLGIAFSRMAAQNSVAPNLNVIGSWTGFHGGSVSFSDTADGDLARKVFFVPEKPFLAGETVFVVLGPGVTGEDSDDALVPSSFSFVYAVGSITPEAEPPAIPWQEDHIVPESEAPAAGIVRIAGGDLTPNQPGLEYALLDTDGNLYLCRPESASPGLGEGFAASRGTLTAIAVGDLRAAGQVSVLGLATDGSQTELLFLRPQGAAFEEDQDAVQVSGDYGAALALGDFDGDANLDALLGGPSGLLLLVRSGGGQQDATFDIAEGLLPNLDNVDHMSASDVNNDGCLDILVRQGASLGVIMWKGTRFGALTSVTSVGEHGNYLPVYLDSDSLPEVAVVRFDPRPELILFNHRSGSLRQIAEPIDLPVPAPTTGGRIALVSGDFTGDGRPELVLGHPSWLNGYTIFPTSDSEGFDIHRPVDEAPAGAIHALAILDHDGDAYLELVGAGPAGVWSFDAPGADLPPSVGEILLSSAWQPLEDNRFQVTVRGRSELDVDQVRVGLSYTPAELGLVEVTSPLESAGGLIPSGASLTTCEAEQGCTDRVIATLGIPEKLPLKNEIDLLKFTFRFLPVAGVTSTLRLESELKDGEGNPVTTAFHVRDENVWINALISDADLTVERGVTATLKFGCDLTIAGDGQSATVDLTWTMPEGVPEGAQITLRRNDDVILDKPYDGVPEGSHTDGSVEKPLPYGEHRYELTVEIGEEEPLRDECSSTFVPSPVLTDCVRVDDTHVALTWEYQQGSAIPGFRENGGFHIWRDEDMVDTLRYDWRTNRQALPTGTFARTYKVSAFLSNGESRLANCDQQFNRINPGDSILPPQEFTVARKLDDPFAIVLSWVQGEGYGPVEVHREGPPGGQAYSDVIATLERQATAEVSYIDPSGGEKLRPGEYIYTLVPIVGSVASGTRKREFSVSAGPITIDLPPNRDLTCRSGGGLQVILTWENTSLEAHYAYDALELYGTWIDADGGRHDRGLIASLPPEEERYVDTVEQAVGTYEYALRAEHGGEVGELTCTVGFATVVRVPLSEGGVLKTGAGLNDIRIPVEATLAKTAKTVSFQFTYAGGGVHDPEEKDGNDRLVTTGCVPGPGVTVESDDPEEVLNPPTGDVTWYTRTVTVHGPVGPGVDVPLCDVLATTPKDFASFGYGGDPLLTPDEVKRNVAVLLEDIRVEYVGDGPVGVSDSAGMVEVNARYLMAESVWGGGVGSTISIPLYGTFDFDLNGYQAPYTFDTNVLEALGAVVEGTMTPSDTDLLLFLGHDNGTGTGHVAWLFMPTIQQPIPAGFHRHLANLQFEVVGAPGPGPEVTIEEIQLDNGQLVNPMLLGVSDHLEVVFHADVHIAAAPMIVSISPDRGPFLGGTRLEIWGAQFGGEEPTIWLGETTAEVLSFWDEYVLCRVPPRDNQALEVPVTVSNSSGQTTAGEPFHYVPLGLAEVVPSSGSMAGGSRVRIVGEGIGGSIDSVEVSFGGAAAGVVYVDERAGEYAVVTVPPGPLGAVDVEVKLSDEQEYLLEAGFTYTDAPGEGPVVTRFRPERGSRFGGTGVTVEGLRFTSATQVFFDGVEAQVDSVDPGGTALDVVTPSHDPGSVTITVKNPDTAEFAAEANYTYEELAVTSASPPRATICGGAEILLVGSSFHEGLQVMFGGYAGERVVLDAADPEHRLFVVTPAVPAGAGDVQISVSFQTVNGEGPSFTFDAQFVRGDTDGNGVVTAEDGHRLSRYVNGTQTLGSLVDAADADDNGVVDVEDARYLFRYFYTSGDPPPPPFPDPGEDPTPDDLPACPEF